RTPSDRCRGSSRRETAPGQSSAAPRSPAAANRNAPQLAVPTVRQWRLASVPRHLPAGDVERLLRPCPLPSATGRRDRAILLLLTRLGLRASEVIALELGYLRRREGEMIVRGKGRVRDRLPLLPEVGEALARYLQKDRPPGS